MLGVVIGGSAGSFPIVTNILAALPKNYPYPLFLCLHRLKHVRTGFVEALSLKSALPIHEPHDREQVLPGHVYLAPANYHMYITTSGTCISLSTEEVVNHSRPSIDITFCSAAKTFGSKCVGILLSGANKDGALGCKAIKDAGATVIVQAPDECQVRTMTLAAMKATTVDFVFSSHQIISYLQKLNG
ncbi:MAG: chemotaxis protein CheB [Bacteroidales bacterium]|jgi:two-component system chemotaxis response regulator CheB|nr:chemotaxis protein CheB [Bacteroidales bacterium]